MPRAEILRQVALFGADNRDGWGIGLTILTALGNLMPLLPDEETYLALFHGARRVAADCDGEAPRRDRAPLGEPAAIAATLKRWLRRWTAVRHRDAAERTLLTAIAAGAAPAALADLLVAAETERVFADGGHSLDFINKAFECLDLIGWEHAACRAADRWSGRWWRRAAPRRRTAWRQPVDLIALCDERGKGVAAIVRGRARRAWLVGPRALAEELLGDDPVAIIEALKAAIRAGAAPADLGRSLAYAAALRVARFGTSNEHADWETAHHVFTYANAVHQVLKRIGGETSAVRSTQSAPSCTAPWRSISRAISTCRRHACPAKAATSSTICPLDAGRSAPPCSTLSTASGRSISAARLVARHLTLGHPPQALIATLAHALLREDAGFHAYQMLEAGVRQFGEWGNGDEGRHILIAVARYIAAHSPTERAALQTADIARRLMRGGELHEAAGSS